MGVFVNIEQGKGSGPVAGDCKHKTHTNWIVAENCTIPTTRPETQTKMGKTTDRTRASVEFEDIQMKKSMDLASPMLMEWNLLGDARKVTIHFTDEKDWYLSLVMENTILTKLDIDADEEGTAAETLSLDFTKIQYQYRTKQDDGINYDPPNTITYDVALGEVSG